MTFLTALQLIFLLIPIVTSLLVPFTPDTDSLSDPETLLESSFSSNKPLIFPGSKVSSKSGSPFSRFLTEVYVPHDFLGLIKDSIHDRKFSSSVFRFAFFKDTVPVPDTFFALSSLFTRDYLFLNVSHSFSTKSAKTKKKISVNKKDLRPKRISEADLGLTAAATKMELFVTIVDGWTVLNIATKSSILMLWQSWIHL